jgi:hypothetical protein
MTDSYTKAAFEEACEGFTEADFDGFYVSLYAAVPFYGGPEEGGWWGEDTELVGYKFYPAKETAELILKKIKTLAESLTLQSHRDYGEQCLRDMDWLDERGLEADYLPEPDGETKFYAVIEGNPGGRACRGSRRWE